MHPFLKRNNTEFKVKSNTALDIYHQQLLQGCLLSYNEELDTILKNELLPGSLTELAGLPGSGKIDICFQLCITVQFPKKYGGLNGEALYINANNNFASHMIKEFAHKIQDQFKILQDTSSTENYFTEEKILQRIHCVNISDCLELQAFLKYLETFLNSSKVRLIIIDSIASLLRKLNLKNRTSITYRIIQNLQCIARKYNVIVIMTNDLTTRVNKSIAYNTPSFGDSFYHRINTRILLTKENCGFKANILKSIMKAPTEA